VVKDELVRHLLETLTTNLRESRVMITSRLDFLFTRDSRYQANILSVLLPDLTIMEAFRLIANMPALCNTTDEEKRLIYEKAGGSPYIIDLVSNAAKDVPIGNVLLDIKELQKGFVETTLLNKLYGWLPDDATKRFFRCTSVYRKPVNQDFLVALGGNDERIGYLLHKSLLNRIAANMYEMHTNTRSFAFDLHEQIDGASGLKESEITAAEMYLKAGTEEGDADDFLESRWFFYSAGEYNKAGELVLDLTEPLHRRGFIDLVSGLNEETVKTATGVVKAAALHHMGMIHQYQGRYEEAVKMYQESLKITEELGDKSGIASTLLQLGNLHYAQGRYEEAEKMSQESLKIKEELGDKSGIALAEWGIGKIYARRGNYDKAIEKYEKCLEIFEDLEEKKNIAGILHQLGVIHQQQGRYEEAEKMYQDSLKIEEELGNKSGIAITLAQMGQIFQVQENYKEALRCYLHAFVIFNELNSPYKDLAGQHISKLKEEIGDSLFDIYYEELTANE
jgi:tetratricopeptide (TPR) repeat protein